MKKHFHILFFIALPLVACNNEYDDSSLWKDIDGIYKSLDELHAQTSSMQQQLDALSAIVGSGAVTGIERSSDGHYVLSYKDADNVEHSVDIATMDEANLQPIIGLAAEGDAWYWTVTTKGNTTWLLDVDGARIPHTGRTPEIGIDGEGYWTVFGKRITDADGASVKAEGKSASVIAGVEISEDGGTVTFTLGGGEKLTAQIQNGFNVLFDVETRTTVTDPSVPMTINYTLVGATASTIISIEKAEGLSATLDEAAKTITVMFPEGFEDGTLMVMLYDGSDNTIIKPLVFTTMEGDPTGITSADDLKAFAIAVNSGGSIAKYMLEGEVRLTADIDMTGVEWSDYIIGGEVTPSTTSPNTGVNYTMSEFAFDGIFNGGGYSLKNVDWTFDVSTGNIAAGLFSALAPEGEIKNLTIEGKITLTGAARQGSTIGAFAGYAEGKLTGCTNKASISFEGSDASNVTVLTGGIAGYVRGATLTGCTNDGEMTCGTIANKGNGANGGFQQGGIAGYMHTSTLTGCTNNGSLSAPSGRGGGIVAVATSGDIVECVNNGTVQDDVNGIFGGPDPAPKRMGGLAGGATANVNITDCTNNGNVFSQLGCRTGGFVGHNQAIITGSTNNGTILSDLTQDGNNIHGAGWAAGYNDKAANITGCTIGGRVGDWTAYKDAPETAPAATFSRAVAHGQFDPQLNGLNDQFEEYYDWEEIKASTLAPGVKYYHYSMTNIKQNVYVVEIDRTNPGVVFETVMADELCLNPNANDNGNNGKNLRETLSETVERRRTEGRNIVAGINTGFFNSDEGFPRGMHIEYGEPVFVNNPTVRASLTNHRPGFTFFEDRTVSLENRNFSGHLKVGAAEYEYFSVNDTIVALRGNVLHDANLYTSRFVHEPHPGIFNAVGSDALFIVGRCTAPLSVNTGYIEATVTSIVDGRGGASVTVPFVTERTDWVLQVTGEKADALKAALTVGAAVQIGADVPIGNVTKPIIMHNSSMYRFLNNGGFGQHNVNEGPMPATCVGVDETGNTVKLVCVDGRTTGDVGLDYWQLFMVMSKLDLHDAIRFDGGGSTTLWTYDGGTGGVVNHPSDSRGERSCLNYMHIRVNE